MVYRVSGLTGAHERGVIVLHWAVERAATQAGPWDPVAAPSFAVGDTEKAAAIADQLLKISRDAALKDRATFTTIEEVRSLVDGQTLRLNGETADTKGAA